MRIKETRILIAAREAELGPEEDHVVVNLPLLALASTLMCGLNC